jgi:hypothetical protein
LSGEIDQKVAGGRGIVERPVVEKFPVGITNILDKSLRYKLFFTPIELFDAAMGRRKTRSQAILIALLESSFESLSRSLRGLAISSGKAGVGLINPFIKS